MVVLNHFSSLIRPLSGSGQLSPTFNIFTPLSLRISRLNLHPLGASLLAESKMRRSENMSARCFGLEVDEDEDEDVDEESVRRGPYRGREEEKDYDRDPEFAEIIGSCLNEPQKARSKMEDRLRKKRNKILHPKTGSETPIFDFSNSYIWFEFYNTPLENDVSLICDTIRSWHIIGRLGGCNSMNMQLSQFPLEKRPSYDTIQGANVDPTTFFNIGDLEVQDNLARIWVDIGTTEPLLLDVLINALTQISSNYVGIKQLTFGGSELENWKENVTSDDASYSVKI